MCVLLNSASHSCVQLKKALEDLTELLAEKEALAQRCEELDIQVNTELTLHTPEHFYRKMYSTVHVFGVTKMFLFTMKTYMFSAGLF